MELDDLLKKWLGKEGGAERANYQMFLTELCNALGLPAPDPKGHGLGDYQFEAPVKSEAVLGTKGTGRIDLYKRRCFILEAKQSQVKPGDALPADPPPVPPEPIYDLFGNPIGFTEPAGKTAPRYDRLMADARLQAERYALALPDDHSTPPFLIVCDIGRTFELYFDWSGNGRGYGFFPDRQNYRIALEDLASGRKLPGVNRTARELLIGIWTDPASVDPRLRAAEVTRAIAVRLSRVAAALEEDQRKLNPGRAEADLALGIEATSLFLMRLLFCMFAEDVELLPKESFQRFLADARDRTDQYWRSGLADLWSKMNQPDAANRYWSFGDAVVRYFNGNLFASTRIFDLPREFKGELLVAAEKDWRAVEPAIFGTLLEQVLTSADRARLGAHYTPRAYVERLVEATIMDVLRPEWDAAREEARVLVDSGNRDGALAALRAFHERLENLRILDPACGTGNFLYVAMEQLLRLEVEALQLAAELGEALEPRVHPNQFLGLELNPRAAVIAELVLWIGWLRHRLANQPESIGEPVLPPLTNINGGAHGGVDAVLVRTATGEPDVDNPRRPPWPDADFIIGNPPFIAGQDIRERLGNEYAEALWKGNRRVPPSADYVMQWWDRAADILTHPGTRLRRFGFVTTNSITQTFSRRVIQQHLGSSSGGQSQGKMSLVMAIADHPWTRASRDSAAVRIAMTVGESGRHQGRLIDIISETGLDTDEPKLGELITVGSVNADLTVGADVTSVVRLKANLGICHDGVKLHGKGFIISRAEAEVLGLGRNEGLEQVIKPYRNGRDLTGRSAGEASDKYVIDLFDMSEREVRQRFPEIYQHLLLTVKPERDENRRLSYRERWWIFGEPRRELRPALSGLERFIATVDTARHRVFRFLPVTWICDDKVVIAALDGAYELGVLSSKVHLQWTLKAGGWLGMGNDSVYVKSRVFDPFPFPDSSPATQQEINEIAGELDELRSTILAENDKLTMTGLYNLVEAVRAGILSPDQEQAAVRARARIVAKLHDDLDAAVAAAYGWPADLPPAEIVARLVALNAERAAEEAAGHIRWLRPDYQQARFG